MPRSSRGGAQAQASGAPGDAQASGKVGRSQKTPRWTRTISSAFRQPVAEDDSEWKPQIILPITARSRRSAQRWATRGAETLEATEDQESAATCSTAVSECACDVRQDFELDSPIALWTSTASPNTVNEIGVYDVVVDADGRPALLPVVAVDGSNGKPMPIDELSDEDIVTIRAFRFMEDKSDERQPWEQQLRNVNSGSLLWLVVHMEPKMHSMSGAKYGKWFVEHHIRVQARCFNSGYHMCEEGGSPAKAFGTTAGIKKLASGDELDNGYMWFVSPDGQSAGAAKDVTCDTHLDDHGWQHVRRAGPFCGEAFHAEWRRQGSPMDGRPLQRLLRGMAAL